MASWRLVLKIKIVTPTLLEIMFYAVLSWICPFWSNTSFKALISHVPIKNAKKEFAISRNYQALIQSNSVGMKEKHSKQNSSSLSNDSFCHWSWPISHACHIKAQNQYALPDSWQK